MFDDGNIKCPDCGEMTGMLIHVDKFPCKCGDFVEVKFLGCPCGFSWRTSDDIFIDGVKVDVSSIQKIMEEADDFLEGLDKLNGVNLDVDVNYRPAKFRSMSDMIHKCIKCGQVAIEKADGLFECTDRECGFSWEVDESDGE